MRALLFSLVLVGCAAPPAPAPTVRLCPPLPELPRAASTAERANHYAVVIRLYAQCAGVPAGEQ